MPGRGKPLSAFSKSELIFFTSIALITALAGGFGICFKPGVTPLECLFLVVVSTFAGLMAFSAIRELILRRGGS